MLSRSAGYIVYQATERQAVLRIARTKALDLLICDINLADGNGLELTREVPPARHGRRAGHVCQPVATPRYRPPLARRGRGLTCASRSTPMC